LGLRGRGEMRRLHNNELNNLHSSPNAIPMIKLRMRWARNVACMGERRGAYRVLMGKPEGRPLGDPDVDGRIILKWTFRKWDGGGCMYWIDLAQDSNRWLTLENKALYIQVP